MTLPFLTRRPWILLLLGIALRCVALNQPLVDAHLIRQCQTAAVTKGLIEQGGWPLSTIIPWAGDSGARYVLEFPLYNFLVIGVHAVVRNLDMAGKVTTIMLWVASFVLLQGIWRRLLGAEQTFWANLLFVVAPLSVFYGQAFMPEMLVQVLAFAFLLLALRYGESATLLRWVACAGVGVLALLVKLPETAHLYFILGLMLFPKEGWRAAFRPRYLVAAVLTAVAVKGWSAYMDSVNTGPLSFGSSHDNLHAFVGTWHERFTVRPWAMIAAYVSVFILPGIALPVMLYGFWMQVRDRVQPLLTSWLLSLAIFYVLWIGNTGAKQSYYNLPALVPIAALFGLGASGILRWQPLIRWRGAAVVMMFGLTSLSAAPVWSYLFKQDRVILDAAYWARANTSAGDPVLLCVDHRSDMTDYPFNPVLSYYSQRPTFIQTINNPAPYLEVSASEPKCTLVTMYHPPARSRIMKVLQRWRAGSSPLPRAWKPDQATGYVEVEVNERFAAYKRP